MSKNLEPGGFRRFVIDRAVCIIDVFCAARYSERDNPTSGPRHVNPEECEHDHGTTSSREMQMALLISFIATASATGTFACAYAATSRSDAIPSTSMVATDGTPVHRAALH